MQLEGLKTGSLDSANDGASTVHREASTSTFHHSSLDAPPSLGYSLYDHKKTIIIFWSLVLLDSMIMPIVLYFALWYKTSLNANAVFSIMAGAVGAVSLAEYVWRAWKLYKSESKCRCAGVSRYHFDFFHWILSIAGTAIIIILIVGTCPTYPPIRLLSMALASALWTFGTILLIVDCFRLIRAPFPFRLSSQPPRTIPRPAIYPIIEDSIAVDGGVGAEYRIRLSERYESSKVFRRMISRLSWFWGFGTEACAVLTTVLVFTLEKEVAFVIGWSLPWVWAAVWALCTFWYVRKGLREERETWGMKGGTGE